MVGVKKNKASMVCQIMANIRCPIELPYLEMVKIFKKSELYDGKKHEIYFVGFFEECRSDIIKAFMQEQNISREEILSIYDKVATYGETHKFKEAVLDGQF